MKKCNLFTLVCPSVGAVTTRFTSELKSILTI